MRHVEELCASVNAIVLCQKMFTLLFAGIIAVVQGEDDKVVTALSRPNFPYHLAIDINMKVILEEDDPQLVDIVCAGTLIVGR